MSFQGSRDMQRAAGFSLLAAASFLLEISGGLVDERTPHNFLILPTVVCLLTGLAGWLRRWDWAFTPMFCTAMLFSQQFSELSAPVLAIYAIGAGWVANSRYIAWSTSFLATSAVVLVTSKNIPADLFSIVFLAAPATMAGWVLRQYRERYSHLQEAAMNWREVADDAAELARRDLVTQLHSTLARDLARISINTQRLAGRVDSEAREEAQDIQLDVQSAMVSLRSLMAGQRDATDGALGAVLSSSESLLSSRRMRLEFDGEQGTAELDQHQAGALGLVAREGLLNVLKHGQEGSTAYVTLEVQADRSAALTIANRVSAKPTPAELSNGLGLGILSEQMQAQGGLVTWGRHGGEWVLVAEVPPMKAAVRGINEQEN
ncbi:hypothetical protein AAEX63_02935 [Luteococcus sp. H138]|uniref:sensor histidine kinase n=1 Tax=unclassified Luteococcus TaxID=2639923 RepID=UPI00313B07A7